MLFKNTREGEIKWCLKLRIVEHFGLEYYFLNFGKFFVSKGIYSRPLSAPSFPAAPSLSVKERF